MPALQLLLLFVDLRFVLMQVRFQLDFWNLGFAQQAIERGQVCALEFAPAFQHIGAVMFGRRERFHLRHRWCGIGLPHLLVQRTGLSIEAGQGDFGEKVERRIRPERRAAAVNFFSKAAMASLVEGLACAPAFSS